MIEVLLVMNGSSLNRGMNTGLENLIWGLAEKGVNATVLAGGSQPKSHEYSYPSNVSYRFLGKVLTNPMEFIPEYKKIVSEKKIDFVIGWLENIAPLAAIPLENKPVFIANEGRTPIRSVYLRPIKWLLNRKIRFVDFAKYLSSISRINKNITSFVGITETVVKEVRRFYYVPKLEAKVIGRGVNTELFQPLEDVKKEKKGKTTQILFTGNISAAKGITDLVGALKTLEDKHKIQLNLLGKVDVDYRQWIESELKDNVQIELRFHGRVNQMQVASFCRETEIFFFGSHPLFEGLGKSLIEAMACGCAVVCSDIDVFKEVVTHDANGLMVPIKSPELLAQALTRYMENPELRKTHGKAARKTVLEKFSKEAEINGWLELLAEKVKSRESN